MTEDEFLTAIAVVRNRYQSKLQVAKRFLTDEQRKVFYSKAFRAERQDKPRWAFTDKPRRKGSKLKPYELSMTVLTTAEIDRIELPPIGEGTGRWIGKVDWTYHTRVTMHQILRLLNGDYEPKYRVVQPREGYMFVDPADKIT